VNNEEVFNYVKNQVLKCKDIINLISDKN